MPMAGMGNRFKKEGYKIPKPLLKVDNTEMFLRSSKSFQKNSSWVFILQKDIYKNKYVELIKKNFKKPVIIFLKKKNRWTSKNSL